MPCVTCFPSILGSKSKLIDGDHLIKHNLAPLHMHIVLYSENFPRTINFAVSKLIPWDLMIVYDTIILADPGNLICEIFY